MKNKNTLFYCHHKEFNLGAVDPKHFVVVFVQPRGVHILFFWKKVYLNNVTTSFWFRLMWMDWNGSLGEGENKEPTHAILTNDWKKKMLASKPISY